MKETLDGAARAWDAWERFMTAVAMVGMFGLGAALLLFPERVPEDFPRPTLVGGVMCGFAALFLFALFAKGRAGSRAKHLLLCVTATAVAGGLGFFSWKKVEMVHALQTEGIERTLPVASNVLKFVDGTPVNTVVLMDGLRRVTLEWDGRLERGQMVTILTHPEHANWTVAASAGATHLEIADALELRWPLIVSAAVAVVAAIAALCFFAAFVSGAPAPDEEPA